MENSKAKNDIIQLPSEENNQKKKIFQWIIAINKILILKI